MGLMSPGGVHSHQHQIAALAAILADAGLPVAVHAFLDGRDTPPKSAVGYLKQFQTDIAGARRPAHRHGRAGAITRWTATSAGTASRRPMRALTAAEGEHAADALAAVEAAYARGETDEFVLPTAIGDYRGMQDGDGLLFANFRADRIREIAGALLDPDFAGFARDAARRFRRRARPHRIFGGAEPLPARRCSRPRTSSDTFGEVVAEAGMKQLRIAETEKYAHVTFFFNGGRETRVSRRGAHPGAVAEGRDLRPAAGDVGPRGHRQGGRRRSAPAASTSSC